MNDPCAFCGVIPFNDALHKQFHTALYDAIIALNDAIEGIEIILRQLNAIVKTTMD